MEKQQDLVGKSANKVSEKSYTLPDPPVFSGTGIFYEEWRILVENKLRVNADHFLDSADRRGYVISRLSGQALLCIHANIEHSLRVWSAEDVIKHLDFIYNNSTLSAYVLLNISQNGTSLSTFLPKFDRLAAIRKMSDPVRVSQLYATLDKYQVDHLKLMGKARNYRETVHECKHWEAVTNQRVKDGRCFKCSERGHFASNCPAHSKQSVASG